MTHVDPQDQQETSRTVDGEGQGEANDQQGDESPFGEPGAQLTRGDGRGTPLVGC